MNNQIESKCNSKIDLYETTFSCELGDGHDKLMPVHKAIASIFNFRDGKYYKVIIEWEAER